MKTEGIDSYLKEAKRFFKGASALHFNLYSVLFWCAWASLVTLLSDYAGWVTFILFSIVFLLGFSQLSKHFRETEKSANLGLFVEYILRQSNFAWLFGLYVATVITLICIGISSAFNDGSTWVDSFSGNIFDIAGIYIGCVIGMLALRYLVDRISPTVNIDIALQKVNADLELVLARGEGKVTVCFPALNIGHFRSLLQGGNAIYDDFKKLLIKVAQTEGVSLDCYIYDKKLYRDLFFAYGQHYKAQKNQENTAFDSELVDRATVKTIDEARNLAEEVEQCSSRASRYIAVMPSLMRTHAIVIDDVVYSIHSWGMPVYSDIKKTFEPSHNGESPVAKLMFYRMSGADISGIVRGSLQYESGFKK